MKKKKSFIDGSKLSMVSMTDSMNRYFRHLAGKFRHIKGTVQQDLTGVERSNNR
jgi:hypothetical protein